MAVFVTMTALFARSMLAAQKMVMLDPAAAPLLPEIIKADQYQYAACNPGKRPSEFFIELETEPCNHETEQAGQQDVSHSGKTGDQERFPATPSSRPR